MSLSAVDRMVAIDCDKYGKPAAMLSKDRDRLLAFYDLPAEHSTAPTCLPGSDRIDFRDSASSQQPNPRYGVARNRGAAMVFKLVQAAERHWHTHMGSAHLAKVIDGAWFHDGSQVRDDVSAQTSLAATLPITLIPQI